MSLRGTKAEEERSREEAELLAAIQRALPHLEEVLAWAQGSLATTDLFYRFYHQSFKVYTANATTASIVSELQALAPQRPLNPWFMSIVEDAAGRSFSDDVNARWLEETRPVVEALLHAKMFLELVVQVGREKQEPTEILPSGWAAVLYLYQLR